MAKKEIIASIDIGSANIVVLIAQYQDNGVFNVLGVGTEKSLGIKNGYLVDISAAVIAIKSAISEAENISGYQIGEIIVGLSGPGIYSVNSSGRVSVRHNEVEDYDIKRALQEAEAVTLPANQEILHTLPSHFVIDAATKVDNPLGMHGDVLEAFLHIITNEKHTTKNIAKSVSQCGVDISRTILNIVAISELLLTRDEKAAGVCVIDIGCDTTDIAVICNNHICHSEILNIASKSVDNDVAYAFSVSQSDAENLKINYGYALSSSIDSEILIDIKQINDERVCNLSSMTLAEVVEARYEEIFTKVADILQVKDLNNSVKSIVLSGGGVKIKACVDLAESVFNKPARIGVGANIEGADHCINDPSYVAGIGLLVYSKSKNIYNYSKNNNWRENNVFSRMGKWFSRI